MTLKSFQARFVGFSLRGDGNETVDPRDDLEVGEALSEQRGSAVDARGEKRAIDAQEVWPRQFGVAYDLSSKGVQSRRTSRLVGGMWHLWGRSHPNLALSRGAYMMDTTSITLPDFFNILSRRDTAR